MNLESYLDKLNKPNAVPGDYTAEDGLLYCGKCHTPKQTRGEGLLAGKLLSITCECKREEMQAAEDRKRHEKADELRKCCLPVAAMARHTFDIADDAKHIQLARRYVERWDDVRKKNVGLIFWGNTGTGKSFTAHCIANALIDRLVPVRVFSVADIISRSMDREQRDAVQEIVKSVPLLVLDDLGAERDTPFAREQLCAIIDQRCESGLPLVVTTNYSVREMDSSSDPAQQRIFDRLRAACVPIAVTGESRRREIGAQKISEARAILEGG